MYTSDIPHAGKTIDNLKSWFNLETFYKYNYFNTPITYEQGKSEGFESCDRPIVRKRPISVKIGDVLYRVTL